MMNSQIALDWAIGATTEATADTTARKSNGFPPEKTTSVELLRKHPSWAQQYIIFCIFFTDLRIKCHPHNKICRWCECRHGGNAEEAADISQEEQSPSELTRVTPRLTLQSAGHTFKI